MSELSIDELTVRVREWRRTIRRTAEMLRGSTVSVGDYDPATHGSLITFTGVPGYEEVERYWVNAPFAFVSINYDPEANEHLYHVVEPELDDVEVELLERLFSDLRESLIYRREMGDETAETVLRDELRELLEVYGVEVDAATYYRLFYYLFRSFRGFGKLDPLINDPHIEDISCDGYDLPIFVYHDTYNDIGTNVVYSKDELDSLVVRLAQQSGQHVSVGEPVVEATLPDGSRAELALGEEVTPRGSAFTIRKYADEPFTPVDLVNYGTFNLDQMAYLWLAIENNKSLIFAGGTASGKTTSMNAISMFIPPRSKVLTIEDTRELTLYHDNWLSSVTRDRLDEGTDITMYDLLRSALRHRPEYIVVGEVRGEEAMTLFQAMNTGHTTYSTMHADSVQTVINRLENEPINVPRAMIQSLDILSIQSLTYVGEERLRRTQTLAEINGIDQRTGDLDYTTTFSWEPSKDTFRKRDSGVLDEIRRDHGWSQSELLTELRDRKLVLQYLRENGISDYRRFTAMVNEYYADPETVVSNVRESTDSAVAELD
ncbi:GspE2 [Haladaptatus paucihalophilus DX253]|uniref:Flagellar protein FlaI n=1 Tax=Haladaptatus paucihalophilus DX253 TaxID=797209 RepID=E7QS51_HALPU|nr:type II/IV secretion system ATPase subunit [Haladaptatus paucihalophilus]EFW92820.1 GspE2 [Haladaptatus paucihalophilus DX253]SHK11735.1 flagellar protein FlaI [Haladaptatus paucihalophilus DX253]